MTGFEGRNPRWLSLAKPGALLLVLILAGCGGASAKREHGKVAGGIALKALCPGAHQVYDALVASDPASQAQFVAHLEDLRAAADTEARSALDPLIAGAKVLAAAGRGPDFAGAQKTMYQGVVSLDAACRTAGSYILH